MPTFESNMLSPCYGVITEEGGSMFLRKVSIP